MYAVHLWLIGKLVGDFLLVIIELFLLGAFVLSQSTCLTDRQTNGQMSIARCNLTKLDAHKNAGLPRFTQVINCHIYVAPSVHGLAKLHCY